MAGTQPGAAGDPHGSHHDVFLRQTDHAHGGATFDAGFGLQGQADPHGKLFDQFSSRPGVERYGDHYDEFGWQEMPVLHGSRFDAEFSSPTAHAQDEHGTWFDAFRGGAQVRYRNDGSDYEGVVIDCNADFATVQSREGEKHEILPSQVFLWRNTPADAGLPDRTEPSRPRSGEPRDAARGGQLETIGGGTGEAGPSRAHAPSAHSAEAAGGGDRAAVDPGLVDDVFANKVETDPADVLKAVAAPGMKTRPRQGVAAAVSQHKTNLHELATAFKRGGAPDLACPGCGKGSDYHVRHEPVEKSGKVTSRMHGECKSCGFEHTFSPPKLGSRQGKLAKTWDDVVEKGVSVGDPLGQQAQTHGEHERLGNAYEHPRYENPHPVGSPEFHSLHARHLSDTAHAHAASGAHAWAKDFHLQAAKHHELALKAATKKGLKVRTAAGGHIEDPSQAGALGKTTDATETAAQAQDLDGGGTDVAGGKAWCGNCKHYCRKVEDGKCPTCNQKVSVRKTVSDDDVIKQLRELAEAA